MGEKPPECDRAAHPAGKRRGSSGSAQRESAVPVGCGWRGSRLRAQALGSGLELEASPGITPLCGPAPGSQPRAASMGARGRASGLPMEGVCVPDVEGSSPPLPGMAEGLRVLGDTHPSSICTSSASQAQPHLLSRLAWGCGITSCIFASGWALPSMPVLLGPPDLLAPKAGLSRGHRILSNVWCGTGHRHKPIAETQEGNSPSTSLCPASQDQ